MGKKKRQGIVYSTDPDFDYNEESSQSVETLQPDKQNLKVYLDKKNRKGKGVTVVENFNGAEGDLKDLGKLLKSKCGVGGSVKDELILIQGDVRIKITEILQAQGFCVRVSGM